MAQSTERKQPAKRDVMLCLIGLLKLFKGILLLAIGIGAFRLLHKDVAEEITHWITALQADPHSRYFHLLITKLGVVHDHQLKQISVGSFFYAGLLLTEGTGLLLQKHWAEYFTILVTGSLIPLEIYELARHVRPIKIAILIVNVAIVIYLVARLRRTPKPETRD